MQAFTGTDRGHSRRQIIPIFPQRAHVPLAAQTPCHSLAGTSTTTPVLGEDEHIIDALARMRADGIDRIFMQDGDGRILRAVTTENLLAALDEQLDAIIDRSAAR